LIFSLRLFVAFACLLLILLNILLLQLPHSLNLVEIYDKALIVRVELLDTLSAKDCQMV
jgi:hypothetical protein